MRSLRWALLLVISLALVACTSESTRDDTPTASSTAATATTAATVAGTAAPNLLSLKTAPERGPVGTKFTVSGEGLPPSTPVELAWRAIDGTYKTETVNNEIQFVERQFAPSRVPIGQATTDAQGKLRVELAAPEDFGGAHDIFAIVAGGDVAKAGFFVEKTVEFSPKEGPIGTPITVRVTGLGSSAFTSTGAIRYDNRYAGFVTATTTRGTAVFTFRAAGPVGDHTIELYGASHTVPYLNIEQSPVAYVGTYRSSFRVTSDDGPPPPAIEWPDQSRISTDATIPRTTIGNANIAQSNARVSLSSASGPIRSTPTLNATGLPAGANIDLIFINVAGNRIAGGWDLKDEPIGKAVVPASGTVSTPVTIPDTLGGHHAVRIVSDGKVLAETGYFVERSLEAPPPQRVKAGEKFKIVVKGVGWTELDNGFAVTYDNSWIGYACGFASNGDVTLELVATGGPGTHLIDMYPMIYDNGHGKFPWQYTTPQLTFAQDHPSLALGYRLPAMHLAIEVVP